jgi:hypothetical protein
MKAKSTDLVMTSVATLEKAELLCTIISEAGTGMIVLSQAPLPQVRLLGNLTVLCS